jgi:hypothetical protein
MNTPTLTNVEAFLLLIAGSLVLALCLLLLTPAMLVTWGPFLACGFAAVLVSWFVVEGLDALMDSDKEPVR